MKLRVYTNSWRNTWKGGSWNYGTEKHDQGEDQAEGAFMGGGEAVRGVEQEYIRTRAGYKKRIYSKNFGSMLLFRCRTNRLKLNWGMRHQEGEVECALCDEQEEETLHRFLKRCSELRHVRARHWVRKKDGMEEILLFGSQNEMKIQN